jgi:hypothetical protein
VASSNGGTARPDRGNVHDRAVTSLAHPGQDSLDQRGRTEEVGGKQLLGLVLLCLLHGRAIAMAGVIDQDIDAAEVSLGVAHDITHLGVVCYIER